MTQQIPNASVEPRSAMPQAAAGDGVTEAGLQMRVYS